MPHHFSFSGCGFLGVYHLGVSACLKQHVPELLEDCKIAGASAGSFVACCLLTDCSIDKCTSYVLDLVNQAESQPILGPLHPRFKLISGLKDSMQQVLPADAYKLASGRLFISLTRCKDLKNVIVSEYESNKELIDALLCSGFVPFYCGIIPPRYKGDYYWDGGLSDNQPVFDEPTITVSPFSGETDICPLDNSSNFIHLNICNSSVQFTQENLHRVSIALFPPKLLTMSEICQQGYNDALGYLQKNGMVNCIYHLNVPPMSNFQGMVTEAEELNTDAEDEPDFDCRECKHNIRKTLFSSLPPRLLKVFHSTMASKDQSILKYIFQGKLFQAMSLMITSCIAPADIVWAYFTSFLDKIPQGQQDLENILKQLSFLFLCFLDFVYKPCKHNKKCMKTDMDSAYSYYCFNYNMEGAIQEWVHQKKKERKPKDNDDSTPNPNIIPTSSEVKVENFENRQKKTTLCDYRELPSSCHCCHRIEAGQVTSCIADGHHLEIFRDSIMNKLGNANMPSVSNNQLKMSKNMEAQKKQNNQTSLLNIEQDSTMTNKRVFERSQSYPLCKNIYDNEIGSVPIGATQKKIGNTEAGKSQYLSKSIENCSSIDQSMFEKFAIDPLLCSQMKNFNETKLQNNERNKQKNLMEAPKENNLYICEVNSITVNGSIVDISAGEVLVDCEFDQEHGHTSVVSQATKSVSCEAYSLSNEIVFNYSKSQITLDICDGLSESSSNLKKHGNTVDISQTMSKSVEAHLNSFNNETVFVNCAKSQITPDIFNDLSEFSSNLKEHGNTVDISQTMSKSVEAHLDSFNNETVLVNSAKRQIIPDERFLERPPNDPFEQGFLRRSCSDPSISSSEVTENGHTSDISHLAMSRSLDIYLRYMNKETVFLSYEKNRVTLDQGFLERSRSDQSVFNSNLKKHGHISDTSRMTMSRGLGTRLEGFTNEAVFVNYEKHNIISEQNFLKRSLIGQFEYNCNAKECYAKFNPRPTDMQTEQNGKPELSKFIENNCKTLNSEIFSNYRTMHTPPRTENYTKDTVGILSDPDNLRTSDLISSSSMRESVYNSSSPLVRHISIGHV